MDYDEGDFVEFHEAEFYGFIRKHVICLLFLLLLYFISYSIVRYFKTRLDNDDLYSGEEDFFVYRVSVWMSCFSLSISIGSIALLPFSVIGSEVLHSYPENYYLKWLNISLINTLWNYVFLLSNLSIFLLLPFSYFFIESQGFRFHYRAHRRRPLLARVYETLIVCFLVIIIMFGITDLFYSMFLPELFTMSFSLLCISCLSTPMLYSFVSLVGVFMLLVSTPMGLAKMFELLFGLLIKQKRKFSTHDPYSSSNSKKKETDNLYINTLETTPLRLQSLTCIRRQNLQNCLPPVLPLSNASMHFMSNGLISKESAVKHKYRSKIGVLTKATRARFIDSTRTLLSFAKYLGIPIIIILLLFFSGLTVLMVVLNVMQLLFGFRALPGYIKSIEDRSKHTFGTIGALLESTIILYIIMASLYGVYSTPILKRIRPSRGNTSITSIILNCTVVLLLSSALPVLARTLGLTSFDLLGDYGRLNWISNFSLVWSYNVLFACSTIVCIVSKFTKPIRNELKRRFSVTRNRFSSVASNSDSNVKHD